MKTYIPGAVTRYAITHCDADGSRRLTFNSNARDTYATAAQAQKHLNAVCSANSADKLIGIYGPHVLDTLRVQPITCYSHGDPAPGGDPIGRYMVAELRSGSFSIFDLVTMEPTKRPFKTKAAAVARCLKLNA